MGVEPAIARVLEAVDALKPEMVPETVALVSIPSVGGTVAESDAQHHMAELYAAGGLEVDRWPVDLAELSVHPAFPGMEVERSEAWGVVGRLPGSGDGPSLMLNGHTDVVPIGDPDAWSVEPFGGEVRNGRLYGRGSCDMKAGVIAAHWACQAIRAAGVVLRGDLVLAPVEGEEDGGLGTFALLERGWRADACVISEPTDLDVVPANAGALTFRLRIRGRSTHASRRTEGVSAIEKFWPIWQALEQLERDRHEPADSSVGRWPLTHPLSIGSIQAGDWASSVPDLLVAEGRLGVAMGESVDHARLELERALEVASGADPWLAEHPVEVEWWGGQFESGRLRSDSDLMDRVVAAHRLAGGAEQQVWTAPYGSDLRLLSGHGGIDTVQYGPGDAAWAHAPDEFVEVDDIATTARTLAVLAIDICGLA
jgi:acetylornithine deacetylase